MDLSVLHTINKVSGFTPLLFNTIYHIAKTTNWWAELKLLFCQFLNNAYAPSQSSAQRATNTYSSDAPLQSSAQRATNIYSGLNVVN